jgi:hypothetical protein
VQIEGLQSADRVQMAAAGISKSNRCHNLSADPVSVSAHRDLGLLAKDRVAEWPVTGVGKGGYSLVEVELVEEEVVWKKRAEDANEYDAESVALPVERIAGRLVYEIVVQDAQLIPVGAMQAGHLLLVRLIWADWGVGRSTPAIQASYHSHQVTALIEQMDYVDKTL